MKRIVIYIQNTYPMAQDMSNNVSWALFIVHHVLLKVVVCYL